MKSLALLVPFTRAETVRSFADTLLIWMRRSHTRRHMRDLDERALADVGLDQSRRDAECARWAWQGHAPSP